MRKGRKDNESVRIVYLGDNRVRGNYGCRATSTGLAQLIGSEHTIVGRISGAHTDCDTGELFYIDCLPGAVYRFLGKRKYWVKIKKILYHSFRLVKRGWKYYYSCFDFVSHDLDKSIDNLIRLLPANPAYQEFDLRQYDFDALVVNGEGSFIFADPPRRESLVMSMVIHWALKMGKKVYFMNAMFSDDPLSKRNDKTLRLVDDMLAKCSAVSLREHMSMDYAKKHLPNVKPVLYPDALFTWFDMVNDEHRVVDMKYYLPHVAECDEYYHGFSFDQPYVLVSGSSSAILSASLDQVISSYSELVRKTKERFNIPVYLIQVCEGDAFLNDVGKLTDTKVISLEMPIVAAAKILANACVFISGRYHPAIMASLGGTPCVFMSSNSHKTQSLQQLLEYEDDREFNVVPSADECQQILDKAEMMVQQGDALRLKIQNRSRTLAQEAKNMLELLK